MSSSAADGGHVRKLVRMLAVAGFMAVVMITYDAAWAWVAPTTFVEAGYGNIGVAVIFATSSIIAVRDTGLIRYGMGAAMLVAVVHSTLGLVLTNAIHDTPTPAMFEPPYYVIRGIQLDLVVALILGGLAGAATVGWQRWQARE